MWPLRNSTFWTPRSWRFSRPAPASRRSCPGRRRSRSGRRAWPRAARRCRRRSPGRAPSRRLRSSASAVGLPQPSEASTAAEGRSATSSTAYRSLVMTLLLSLAVSQLHAVSVAAAAAGVEHGEGRFGPGMLLGDPGRGGGVALADGFAQLLLVLDGRVGHGRWILSRKRCSWTDVHQRIRVQKGCLATGQAVEQALQRADDRLFVEAVVHLAALLANADQAGAAQQVQVMRNGRPGRA